jgi:hydrogenase-4 membrane subunit HyfE
MLTATKHTPDLYEAVLKQILAEVTELSQKIAVKAIGACQNTNATILPALFLKAPLILRIILPCDNLICVIYKIAWLRPAKRLWAELKPQYYRPWIR